MLYLIFQAGGDSFALGASLVVEVVPLVRLRNVPHAPHGVAGVFNYRGTIIPVIDLASLIVGTASSDFYSTRIIVTRVQGHSCDPDSKKTEKLVGLIAEKATEIMSLEEEIFEAAAMRVDEAPYLGDVVSGGSLDADGVNDMVSEWGKAEIIQRIDATALLTPDIRRALDIAGEIQAQEKGEGSA